MFWLTPSVLHQSFLLSSEVDPNATRHLPVIPLSSPPRRASTSTGSEFDTSQLAVWIRNGTFKYEVEEVTASKAPGSEKAGEKQRLIGEGSDKYANSKRV